MSETGMTENQMYRFTMGSVRDPLVANKGAPRKNYNSSTKNNKDGLRIKAYHETHDYKCSNCHKGGHNKRECPLGVSQI
jgi:hypothetical protein